MNDENGIGTRTAAKMCKIDLRLPPIRCDNAKVYLHTCYDELIDNMMYIFSRV
jgi:hypothetical protein